ncbi:unnamed protein product, partial [Rotaria sp. Silwood1]
MLLRHRGWEQVAQTKTKRSTVISILRWTLLRHVTQSLDQINDEDTKKNILWEEIYLCDEEARRERFRCRIEKRKEIIAAMSDSNRLESPFHRTIFATLDMKYNPQPRQSYFSSLFQKVFRCFKHIDRVHSPAYIIISDLSHNFQTCNHLLPHEHSTYFHSTRDLYIDLFDKDRLIYLTPDSSNEMTHFDHMMLFIFLEEYMMMK